MLRFTPYVQTVLAGLFWLVAALCLVWLGVRLHQSYLLREPRPLIRPYRPRHPKFRPNHIQKALPIICFVFADVALLVGLSYAVDLGFIAKDAFWALSMFALAAICLYITARVYHAFSEHPGLKVIFCLAFLICGILALVAGLAYLYDWGLPWFWCALMLVFWLVCFLAAWLPPRGKGVWSIVAYVAAILTAITAWIWVFSAGGVENGYLAKYAIPTALAVSVFALCTPWLLSRTKKKEENPPPWISGP